MLVELGCRTPAAKIRHDDPSKRPIVIYSSIPSEYGYNREVSTNEFRRHLMDAVMTNNGITNLDGAGGEQALLPLTHPNLGVIPEVAASARDLLWAWSDDAQFQTFLSEYHQIPEGRPANYDGDYWRRFGPRKLAPGVMPTASGPQNLITRGGYARMAAALVDDWLLRRLAPGVLPTAFGPKNLVTNVGINNFANQGGGNVVGITGVGSAAGTTSVTTGSTLVTNAWAGAVVYVADTTNHQIVYGNVISNNNTGSASIITVDQWYNVGTPGGAAATTPAAGFEWLVTFAIPPAWFMGITTTNISPSATDTSLTGEATANGMGRKIAGFTVTSAASGGSITFTLNAVYTYGTTGALTFYALGLFPSIVKSDATDTLTFETLFSGSATVTNNGDTLR